MSWGIKITVVYVGFVLMILSLVIISATSKSELVAKDYYAQELAFQEKIDAMANETGLQVSITHSISENAAVLRFPQAEMAKDFSGDVLFFRPSDASKDLKIKLAFDANGQQLIAKNKLSKGVYKMCISWINNATTYYKEEIITI